MPSYVAWAGLRLLQISPLREISSTTTFESPWTGSQPCGQKMLDLGSQACCWNWLYSLSELMALAHAEELSPANLPFPRARSPSRISILGKTRLSPGLRAHCSHYSPSHELGRCQGKRFPQGRRFPLCVVSTISV